MALMHFNSLPKNSVSVAVHTKNFVRVEPVELARQERYFANAMFAIILSLLCSIRQGFRTRAAIQAEILALRHQLLVLQRSVRTQGASYCLRQVPVGLALATLAW